jgi:GNAT superfamily N-acetyltransferase
MLPMAGALIRVPFTEELLPKVQSFACGDDSWEREASDWIKAPRGSGGGIDALEHGDQVWLYVTSHGDVVGFGSLGAAEQRWPRAKDPTVPVSIIPMLGLDRRFWGQPAGPAEERYSSRILEDLIAEARTRLDERPILILFVHLKNRRAFRLYERAGFADLHKPYTDKQTGQAYQRMFLALKTPRA